MPASRRAEEGADMREEIGRRQQQERAKRGLRKEGSGPASLWFPRPFHLRLGLDADMGLAHTEVDHGTRTLADSSICRQVLESTPQNIVLS